MMKSQTVTANNINLHFLEFKGNQPTIILMHGLTANAHAFDGLISAGLSPAFHVISVDLRGRGQSTQPSEGYTMADHAADILGLMDHLNIDKAILGGHSFGGFLALYIARFFPNRVEKIILMDAAANMHPNTKEMLGPALGRLDKFFNSADEYLAKVKAAPYIDFWDPLMENYYKADIQKNENGTVSCIPKLSHMMEAVVKGSLGEPWPEYLSAVEHETILINAPGIYTMGAALLPEENAMETVELIKNCMYVKVPGNHQTMLYGQGAIEIVQVIKHFLKS